MKKAEMITIITDMTEYAWNTVKVQETLLSKGRISEYKYNKCLSSWAVLDDIFTEVFKHRTTKNEIVALIIKNVRAEWDMFLKSTEQGNNKNYHRCLNRWLQLDELCDALGIDWRNQGGV